MTDPSTNTEHKSRDQQHAHIENSADRNTELRQISNNMFTPIEVAVQECKSRAADPILKQRVTDYLQGEVPHYIQSTAPSFYLSRFLATPNYELLHVAKLATKHNLPLLVGQDKKSIFSAQNELKRYLAKLPITKGVAKNGDDIFEYLSLIDFPKWNNTPISEIQTHNGKKLETFHQELINLTELQNVIVVDETDWLDSHHRNDIYAQYKTTWTLMSCYGIMFESFTPQEYEFLVDVMYPSFQEVERDLGVRPLLVEHITPEQEKFRNWNAYATELYEHVRRLYKDYK